MPSLFTKLDLEAIQTLRGLAIDAVESANSGHPGLPLGAAPMAYVLFKNHLRFDPRDANWPDRDRFVLSPGHGSALIYGLLHLFTQYLPLDELKKFRQWGSLTPGHPEFGVTPGVEATTGPLGQGAANIVGMAIAERKCAHLLNQGTFQGNNALINHWTYALVSDGDLMEGISAEAASLAGHLKLGHIIALYDANDISLDGATDITFTENVAQRYVAYGWHVQTILDGNHNLDAIDQAIHTAKLDTERPSLIIVKTTIGFGSPNKEGRSSSHGSPLGQEETRLTKERLGLRANESFDISTHVTGLFTEIQTHKSAEAKTWQSRYLDWSKEFPTLSEQWNRNLKNEPITHIEWPTEPSAAATRVSLGVGLNAWAAQDPFFFGGDADLSCSTNTAIKGDANFNGQSGSGRNIRYGVREHAMAAIANGIAYHGGLRTFTSTFFCFFDYMKPAIRLAAMNHLPVITVWTHDSFALGEDGPTHQPVEHLAALRAIPNSISLRPCDAYEAIAAWKIAHEETKRPIALLGSRQKLPNHQNTKVHSSQVIKGAYILETEPTPGTVEIVIIASGAEVHLASSVCKSLREIGANGVRLVSMPSMELFAEQSVEYQNHVLGLEKKQKPLRVSIEAASSFGWHRWVGEQGIIISLDRFGASAPDSILFEKFGFTTESIVQKIRDRLTK